MLLDSWLLWTDHSFIDKVEEGVVGHFILGNELFLLTVGLCMIIFGE